MTLGKSCECLKIKRYSGSIFHDASRYGFITMINTRSWALKVEDEAILIITICYGLNYVLPKFTLKPLTLNETVFGDRFFKEVIKAI